MQTWPILKSYGSGHLRRIAMPLGGIGTGTVSIGGRGNLCDWELMNRPAKRFIPRWGRWDAHTAPFFALWLSPSDGPPACRLLEGPLDLDEYDGDTGAVGRNHGLPRFCHAAFDTAYPLAQVNLHSPDLPVRVRLDAFNPLVPGDVDASSLPVAILRYVVTNQSERELTAAVCGTLVNYIGLDGQADHPSPPLPEGGCKNQNTFRTGSQVRGLYMDSENVPSDHTAYGTMALTSLADAGVSACPQWPASDRWNEAMVQFWDTFSAHGDVNDLHEDGAVDMPVGSLSHQQVIPAKGDATFTFLLTWRFPNRRTWTPSAQDQPCCPDVGGACDDPDIIGNYYATQFADAFEVAEHVAKRLPDLERRTVGFVRAFVESDLPAPIKEAALFNISTLRSQTCFRTADGRFYGWEGVCDGAGCCLGSCTHVWNYEHTTAFLFGDLAKSMREIEFAQATDDAGRMSFRIHLPIERAQEFPTAAADGQMGCIMKLYRDWQMTGDEQMLRDLWPHARRALEFCWIDGGWDADRDGVMEGCQHNTMDVEYFGPNPQMTGWYLGALRAAEQMARHRGEQRFADECRALFESGSKWMDTHLFNGDYYEHEIRPPTDPGAVPACLFAGMGSRQLGSPNYQLGAGCLVDQLVGQTMAHLCGLGYLHDQEKVRTTLGSIWRLNRKVGFAGHFNPMRGYALGDESALLMAAYPEGKRPALPFPYFSEVMTGFEYTAAIGMIQEGMEDEAIQCIADIRARYDGRKRNPFDETECGRHYARAMASWGAAVAWTGFRYSGINRTVELGPRPGRFFWSTGFAWGVYELRFASGQWQLSWDTREGECPATSFVVAAMGVQPTWVSPDPD